MKKIKSSLILLTFAATAICGLGFAAKTTSKEAVPTFATYTNHDADTYYSGISDSLTGDSLLSALQSLNSSKRKTTVGYSSMGTTPSGQFKYTDYDPDSVQYDSNGQPYGTKLITFYSGNSATSGMNREHVWPNSHGGNSVENDIHMPRPTLQAENGSRGNSFYVEGKCHSSNGWDPAMESFGVESYRGDSARIILYCVVANSKLSLLEADSHTTSNSNRDNLMGRLSDLIKWHLKYPVLEREQNRNEGAEYLQGNRNPFIDHRSYACKIWGNSNSTTKSYCDQYNGWTDGDEPTPTKTLTDLTYSGTPTKKNYLVGESFDSTGLTVTAKFSDNTSQTVTDNVTWSTLVEGQTSVTGSYTYQGTTKNVVVSGITVSKPVEKTLSSLSMTGTLAKKDYLVGESFDPSGLTITANFSDGSSQTVTTSVVWPTLVEGQTSIKGSYTYKGITEEITVSGITVTKPIEKTLSSLSKTGTLTKKDYVVGESFNPTGLTITANFSDGSSEIVTNQVVWPKLTVNQTSITGSYTYEGVTKTIAISGITVTEPVKPKTLVGLNFDGELLKKDYVVGESFNPTGLTITALYSDGSLEDVSELVKWSPLSKGDTSVTGSYTYLGVTETVSVSGITVTEPVKPKTLVGLNFDGELAKKDYVVGESFDPTGLTITASYSDDTSENVTQSVTWSSLKVGDTSVTGSYSYEGTTKTVTISGLTVKEIEGKQVGIVVVKNPTKVVYNIGDVFELDGIKVISIFDNGKSVEVTDEIKIGYPNLTTAGTKLVNVSYENFKTTFCVVVLEATVTKIDLTVHPHKEEYYKNEKFNSSGAVVKAHLSNGTIIDNVIDQCSFTYDFNKSEWVTVSFCDQSQQFKITILQGSPSIQHKAADFAYSFNAIMSEIDVANVSMQKWESMKYYFNQLDAASKAFIKNLNTNDGEGVSAGVSNEEALTECVNKYDDTYLEHKDEGFEDFIGRNPKPRETSKEKGNDDLLVLIAVIGGIVLLTIIIVSIAVPVSKKHKRARA